MATGNAGGLMGTANLHGTGRSGGGGLHGTARSGGGGLMGTNNLMSTGNNLMGPRNNLMGTGGKGMANLLGTGKLGGALGAPPQRGPSGLSKKQQARAVMESSMTETLQDVKRTR